jgi:isoquinoline 1-oxidoreductase beta subunit
VKASQVSAPQDVPLKPRDKFLLIGKSMPRLDIPDKVEGKGVFGTDIFVPGMLYSALERPVRPKLNTRNSTNCSRSPRRSFPP